MSVLGRIVYQPFIREFCWALLIGAIAAPMLGQAPVVTLHTPVSGSTHPTAAIAVDYSATDETGVDRCEAQVDAMAAKPFPACDDFVLSYVHLEDPSLLFALDFAESPLVDKSGQALDPTAGSGTATTSPGYGRALELNGTTDRIDPLSPVNGPFHRAFAEWTFEAWVRPNATGPRQTLIDVGNSNDGFWVGFENDQLRFAAQKKPIVVRADTPYLDTVGWHHIAAVFDNGTLRLYVDGVLAATTAATFTTVPQTPNEAGVGFSNNSDAGDVCCFVGFYGGAFDELAMYERALTPAEILGHARAEFLAGAHSLTVRAFDALGQSAAATANFTIAPAGPDAPPQLTIVTPTEGSTQSAANVAADYTASDDAGLERCEAALDSGAALPFPTCADFVLSYVHLPDAAKLYALDFAEPGAFDKSLGGGGAALREERAEVALRASERGAAEADRHGDDEPGVRAGVGAERDDGSDRSAVAGQRAVSSSVRGMDVRGVGAAERDRSAADAD